MYKGQLEQPSPSRVHPGEHAVKKVVDPYAPRGPKPRKQASSVAGGSRSGGGGEGSSSVARGALGAVVPPSADSLQKSATDRILNQSDTLGGPVPVGSESETGPVWASGEPPIESDASVPLSGASQSPDGDEDDDMLPTDGIEAGRYAYESLLALARRDVNTFNEFVLKDEETGADIEQARIHLEMQATYDREDFMIVLAHPESGKALPLDAEIATPSGWVAMGDLRVGDEVLGGDGRACRVLFTTPTMLDHALYDVVLDDGAVVRADAEHRWLVRDSGRWKNGRRSTSSTRVVTTVDMLGSLSLGDGRARWAIPVAGPLERHERDLPVPPYVLGAWLGDGDADAAWLTFHEDDREVWDRCLRLIGSPGGRVIPDARRSKVMRGQLEPLAEGRVSSLRRALGAIGVRGDKHIPRSYLDASIAQREELLAGLLDTDGSISRKGSRVELSSSSKALADGVLKLVRSLGFKATVREGAAMLEGREVGRRWRVSFTATRQVFRLARKAARVEERESIGARLAWRQVVDVRPAPTAPVRCIRVSSIDSTFVTGREACAVTHNTQQFAVGRTLFELGNNPDLRTVFLNNGQDGAKKNLSATKKYLERSKELRAVFPHLRPGGLWREDAITIERKSLARDPSIYCLGFHGNILGARIDRAVVDDLLDYENTRSAPARADTSSWFRRTFMTRLTSGAKMVFLTNAWHEEDLAHELGEGGWVTLRYPVLDEAGNPTWPERWPLHRIRQVRKTQANELEFARMYMCEPRDPGAMSFRPEWLRAALRLGMGYRFVDNIGEPPSGTLIVTGCDLGASRKMTGGATTMFTIAVHPSGMRQLVAARAGRWSGGDVMRNLSDVADRFGGVIVVEDNGIQKHIVDLANEEGSSISVPVLPFYTGRNKYDEVLGIDAMAAEFEANRWRLPSGRNGKDVPDEVRRLLGEMRAYVPGAHPGDRLMGLWFARTWALRRLRGMQTRKGEVRARIIGGHEGLPSSLPRRADAATISDRIRRLTAGR